MKPITIVMYHYVRELPFTRYPQIKGLLTSEFVEQLKYFKKNYTFLTVEECIDAVRADATSHLPDNGILLTFDDGYSDHYTNVFPVLDKMKIQGAFFPPAMTITEHTVLDVNKIHFILASCTDSKKLVGHLFKLLDDIRKLNKYDLLNNSNTDIYNTLSKISNRYDTPDVVFIKSLLQFYLPEELRNKLVDDLFLKFVTTDEAAFAQELYMNVEQIQLMARHGMHIGSHGNNHYWLDKLTPEQQKEEVENSLLFLNTIGIDMNYWTMCYPYGAYNQNLLSILQERKEQPCAMGFTTEVGKAELCQKNILTLSRMDTNDFPKRA